MTPRPARPVRPARAAALLAAGALVAAGLAACSSGTANRPSTVSNAIEAREKAGAAVAAPAAAAAPAAPKPCSPTADTSYDPLPSVPSTLPTGSLEATIRARNYLVVGVAGDSRLLGARNRLNDAEPQGFDIEMAKSIARAIFGSDGHVQFKVITAGQRFPQVNTPVDGKGNGVDLVARAVSMTCDRWAATDPAKGSAFSAAYLTAEQRMLVRQGVASLDALIKSKDGQGARVCAPVGSTSLTNIAGLQGVTPVPVAIHSDCLALWQEGRVDAITGDDVILAGFKDQDPTAVVLTKDKVLETTPYGLAVARAHPEFVQYINAVMATPQFRADWQRAYEKFLATPLTGAQKPFPTAKYGRPLP